MIKALTIVSFKLVLLLFLSSNSIAGFWTIPEGLPNSCVLLTARDKPIGTGFILFVKESSHFFTYLVSAKHVIREALSIDPTRMKIRLNRSDSSSAENIEFLPVLHEGKPWIEHKNPSVDIAVIPVPIAARYKEFIVSALTVSGVEDGRFATRQWLRKYSVRQGDQVFTLGLLPYLYNPMGTNLVLARFGKISLLTDSEIDIPGGRQRAYFIDCASFPGNSGGPAFVLLERNEKGVADGSWSYAILGIVTEFLPSVLRTGKVTLVERDVREQIIGLENTGIAKVVPVDYTY